jgi:hypothetical protein
MEIALFVLSFILLVPSVTTAIDAHRNANWQKVQGLSYICGQEQVPPQLEKECKEYLNKKDNKKTKVKFYLDK